MNKRTNKRAATLSPVAAKKTNADKSTTGRTAEQLILSGMPPPPERGEGPVEAWLRARPVWVDRLTVADALRLTDREVRYQAENSGGLVIFGSGRGQGLKHAIHADTFELRACRNELRSRGRAAYHRADEVDAIIQQREAGR